jgi:hypothetical protein
MVKMLKNDTRALGYSKPLKKYSLFSSALSDIIFMDETKNGELSEDLIKMKTKGFTRFLLFVIMLTGILLSFVKESFCQMNLGNASGFFISPGIKLGYDFGKRGGFVLGFEASAGRFFNLVGLVGIVGGFSHCFNRYHLNNYYFEVESGTFLCGGSFGVLVSPKEETNPYLDSVQGKIVLDKG